MSSTPNAFLAKNSWQTPRNARTLRAYMALRNQEIAERLKELRARRGNPPQRRVADAVGIEPRTLQTWEAGDAKPSFRNLESIARYYGVSETYILTGEENGIPESPVVVTQELDDVREEFRGYVAQLDEKLDTAVRLLEDARSEREAIRALLTQQEQVLADIRTATSQQADAARMLNEGAQLMLDAQASQAKRAAQQEAQGGTRRRLGEG